MKRKLMIVAMSSLLLTTTANANLITIGGKILQKIWKYRYGIVTTGVLAPDILSAAGLTTYGAYDEEVKEEIEDRVQSGATELRVKYCNSKSGNNVAVPEEFKVCPNGDRPNYMTIKIPQK